MWALKRLGEGMKAEVFHDTTDTVGFSRSREICRRQNYKEVALHKSCCLEMDLH